MANGMTESEAQALAEKAGTMEHVKAEVVPNRGRYQTYSVLLKNTRHGRSAKVSNESQMGMLLLAWGVIGE